MAWFNFAKQFPRRLRPVPTLEQWQAMAKMPSYRCPAASELLDPDPFLPPEPPPIPIEGRRLLDAILQEPEADSHRLAFADWCDQAGDPRGGLIRSQIERGESARPDDPAVRWWKDALSPWSAEDLEFHRGFPEACSLAGRAFLSISAGLFRATPMRSVRLVAIAPYIRELAESPAICQLHCLDLSCNWIGSVRILPLLESHFVSHLDMLDLSCNDLDDSNVPALLALTIPRLRIAENPRIGWDGIQKLQHRFGSGLVLE